jgi:hypothetical protein
MQYSPGLSANNCFSIITQVHFTETEKIQLRKTMESALARAIIHGAVKHNSEIGQNSKPISTQEMLYPPV